MQQQKKAYQQPQIGRNLQTAVTKHILQREPSSTPEPDRTEGDDSNRKHQKAGQSTLTENQNCCQLNFHMLSQQTSKGTPQPLH